MSEENKPNYTFAIVTIIFFIGVAFGVSQYIEASLAKGHHGSHHSKIDLIKQAENENQTLNKVHSSVNDTRKSGAKRRTLKEFYARRAYPGAPPLIPHGVENDGIIADRCLTCHENGGYVPSYNAYAPVSPHPEKESCRQCHVPQETSKPFVATDWTYPKIPKRNVTALGGSPPRIPHKLQLRENCLACHSGPGAVEEVRVSHPERENCQQCHVPQEEKKVFKSNYGILKK
jgi:nitrate reductase (cytochrome), electron transfer subunit